MSSGERPIGAAKDTQSDTEALCQGPPRPPREANRRRQRQTIGYRGLVPNRPPVCSDCCSVSDGRAISHEGPCRCAGGRVHRGGREAAVPRDERPVPHQAARRGPGAAARGQRGPRGQPVLRPRPRPRAGGLRPARHPQGRGQQRGLPAADPAARVWEGGDQGDIRREGASEAAPEAVRQAVGGGCQSGWGRLLSLTSAIEAGTWRQGDSGWV